jgi:Tol biopolymer transport system component
MALDSVRGMLVAAAGASVLASGCQPAATPPPASVGVATAAGMALESTSPTVTPDGRYVAFASSAVVVPGFEPAGGGGSNLARRHIYRLDRTTGQVIPVSVDASGGPLQLDHNVAAPSSSSMSADGRYVAFTTTDPNVVPHDTTMSRPPSIDTTQDVFVRDVQAGTTERIELPGGGDLNTPSANPQISGNGRWVTFTTAATNIDPVDGNLLSDVYRWDRTTGALDRVSVAADGGATDKSSLDARPLDDGNVVFESRATNMASGFVVSNNRVHTYVKDLGSGALEVVSVSSAGTPIAGELLDSSADGRRILFRSDQAGVPDDVAGSTVFLRDRPAATTTVAIRTSTGTVFPSSYGSITANGRYVVSPSRSTSIVPGDVDGSTTDDLFVRDLTTDRIYQVNRQVDGTPGPSVSVGHFDLSDDGRTVVFASNTHAYAADDGSTIERAFIQRTPLP